MWWMRSSWTGHSPAPATIALRRRALATAPLPGDACRSNWSRPVKMMMRSRHSRRIDPMMRSTCAFCDPEPVAAVRNAASPLARLGHDVEEKNMALDAASAWKSYTAMTPAESPAVFDILAPLAGRPMTQTDVEPVTWAIIQRGRAQTAVQHVSLMNAMHGLSRETTADL